MLRKFAYNKIFRTTGMLLLLLLLLVFPASKEYSLEDEKTVVKPVNQGLQPFSCFAAICAIVLYFIKT